MSFLMKWAGLALLGFAVFGIAYHYNKRFLDWIRFQSLGTRDYIVEKLSIMFVDVQPQQILIGQFVISFGFGLLVFFLFIPNVVPGLMFGALATAIGWKAPRPIVDYLYQRRVNRFVLQMVDALSLMSNGMRSGLSISQALGLVTEEMSGPVREEFNLVLNQNRLGVPLEEAFLNLSKRIESDDVEMFVTSINILKETGGNLAETFDTIVTTIRERIKVEGKISALTASARIQGIAVCLVPPGLAIILHQTDPEFMAPLFTTPIGWAILFAVFALEAIGLVFILRMSKISV